MSLSLSLARSLAVGVYFIDTVELSLNKSSIDCCYYFVVVAAVTAAAATCCCFCSCQYHQHHHHTSRVVYRFGTRLHKMPSIFISFWFQSLFTCCYNCCSSLLEALKCSTVLHFFVCICWIDGARKFEALNDKRPKRDNSIIIQCQITHSLSYVLLYICSFVNACVHTNRFGSLRCLVIEDGATHTLPQPTD